MVEKKRGGINMDIITDTIAIKTVKHEYATYVGNYTGVTIECKEAE